MISRGLCNGDRLRYLEQLVTSGAVVYPELALQDGRLADEDEVEHLRGLLELRRLGLLGQTLPQAAATILATLPVRLADYVRTKYPAEAIVGFAVQEADSPAEIPVVFIEDAVEHSPSGSLPGQSTPPGRRRDSKGRLIAKPKSEQDHAAIGPRRRKRILEAHKALRECDGNEAAAAAKLNLPLVTFRRHIRWTPPDDLQPALSKITGRRTKRAQAVSSPSDSNATGASPEQTGFARLRALLDDITK